MGPKSYPKIPTGIFSLLIIAYVLFSTFFHHSHALSINHLKPEKAYDRLAISKRAIPSYEEILEMVVNQAEDVRSKPENRGDLTTIFYTALAGGIVRAECWAKDNIGEANYLTYNQAVSSADAVKLFKGVGDDSAQTEIIQKLISRALAENAEGEIILLIEPAAQPDPESTWVLYEFPAIQHDTEGFTEVYRVDPKSGLKQLIWQKGQAPTLPRPRDN